MNNLNLLRILYFILTIQTLSSSSVHGRLSRILSSRQDTATVVLLRRSSVYPGIVSKRKKQRKFIFE